MDREKVIKGLLCCAHTDGINCIYCPYDNTGEDCTALMSMDALAMLKEQEGYVSVPFSWLVKFCTHIDFKEPMSDQERELLWREKLDQQFGIKIRTALTENGRKVCMNELSKSD